MGSPSIAPAIAPATSTRANDQTAHRAARADHFLMCPPTEFDVTYAINPWMDPGRPVDRDLAIRQWTGLRAAYEALGHTVEVAPPEPGLPDMVYAANAALVLDGIALLARFHHPQRRGEEAAYGRWFAEHDFTVVRPEHVNEGEGDLVLAGDTILAGSGFRTDPAAHREVARVFDREVLGLELVDPRFYHLDTALFALGPGQVAYFPGAFSLASRQVLRARFPDAIVADEADALAFGLNAICDGRHVFLPAPAEGMARRLDAAGWEPVPIDLSELLRGGGSVKCCTLELRR
jgi:N-dimethylarginine dimethylaminohydrolase